MLIVLSGVGFQSEPVGRDVFRVFLENGQIRTMKFSELMTVGEVIDRLCEKLALRAIRHFSLMLEGPGQSQLVYLPNHYALANVRISCQIVWHWLLFVECRLTSYGTRVGSADFESAS